MSVSFINKVRLKPSPLLVAGIATLAVTAAAVVAGPARGDVSATPAAAKPPTITVGSNPIDVAIAPKQSEAYVLNDGSVSVINLRNHKQVAEVGTGFQDQTALGVTNGGARLYIGTYDENQVKVFNTNTRRVIDTVKVGYGATGITRANTAKGQFAYVGLGRGKKVVVVNTKSRTVVRRIATPRGVQAVSVVPGSKQVWAASSYNSHIWIIDTARQRIVKTINVADVGPAVAIAFGPGGNRAWIAGMAGVSVVSVKTGKQLAFIPITRLFPRTQDLNMGDITLAAGGRVALVVNSTFPDNPGQGEVRVLGIGAKRIALRRIIPLGTEPTSIAVDARRTTAYATNYQDDTLSYFGTPGR